MFTSSTNTGKPTDSASSAAPGREAPQQQQQPAQQPAQTQRSASTEPSIISPDLKVMGDLHCSGDLQVKGHVKGDIRSRSVTIGEGANVEGSVMADTVTISGTIKGQIEAPTVNVARSAKVMGDIVHQTLAVEAGAHLDGNIRRLESKASGQGGVSTLKTAGESERKAASAS